LFCFYDDQIDVMILANGTCLRVTDSISACVHQTLEELRDGDEGLNGSLFT
jgi:hypothetical protein